MKEFNDFPIFEYDDLVKVLYSGNINLLPELYCDNVKSVKQFNDYAEDFQFTKLNILDLNDLNCTKDNIDFYCQHTWLMPDSYKTLDIEKFILDKCNTTLEIERATEELKIYKAKDMLFLLKYLIYLMEVIKQNNILIGVGRGSSVASFVLYKLGIHRINPLDYGLDFSDFIK